MDYKILLFILIGSVLVQVLANSSNIVSKMKIIGINALLITIAYGMYNYQSIMESFEDTVTPSPTPDTVTLTEPIVTLTPTPVVVAQSQPISSMIPVPEVVAPEPTVKAEVLITQPITHAITPTQLMPLTQTTIIEPTNNLPSGRGIDIGAVMDAQDRNMKNENRAIEQEATSNFSSNDNNYLLVDKKFWMDTNPKRGICETGGCEIQPIDISGVGKFLRVDKYLSGEKIANPEFNEKASLMKN